MTARRALAVLVLVMDVAWASPMPAVASGSKVAIAGGFEVAGTLARIRGCESGSGPRSAGDYLATNRRSSASGAFQILDGTWRSWRRTFGADVGASRFARARSAPPWVQDFVAVRAFAALGGRPWAASRRCWR